MLPGIGHVPSPTHTFPQFESQGEATVFATGTDDEDRLSAAQSNLPSIGGKLKVIGTASIDTSNLTIDADTELDLTSGRIDVASGRTLTVLGSVTPTDRQIFSGSGTITFGTENRRLNAHWFASASQCVAACPDGGEIKITRNLDVASYGRFIINDKIIHFRGIGWGRDATNTAVGPRVINTGGDVVDSPVIEYNSASQEEGGSIRGTVIDHEGATSFAVLVDNHIYSVIEDNLIFLNNTGFGGVKYDNDAFFSRMARNKILGFTDFGVDIQGNGTDHTIRDCHIASGQSGSVAVRTELPCTIESGQINSSGTNGVGIQFNANGADIEGSVVDDVLFEFGLGVEFAGTAGNSSRHVRLRNLKFTLGQMDGGVKFDRAVDCDLEYPHLVSPGGADTAEFTANSQDCRVWLDESVSNATYTVDASATRPKVIFKGPMATGLIDNINTDANLLITIKGGYISGQGFQGGDVHHSGVGWDFQSLTTLSDDAATSFTPAYDRGFIEIGGWNNTANACIVAYEARTGASEAVLLGGGSNVAVTTGALAGTTGTDGNWTVSAHTDGKIYIENRTGGTESFTARVRAGYG